MFFLMTAISLLSFLSKPNLTIKVDEVLQSKAAVQLSVQEIRAFLLIVLRLFARLLDATTSI